MTQEFVPYELAVKLKALGFDEPCLMYIDDEEDLINDNTAEWIGAIKCPLKSQAFRWFREKHGLSAIVSQFGYSIENSFGGIEYYIDEDENPTCYEEAELACLEKLIEIVESKSE